MSTFVLLATMSMLMVILPRSENPDAAASLGGRVTDENLVVIASATISARNAFSGEIEFAKTNEKGLYRFTDLKQGRYSVFGGAEGYGCTWVLNVFLFRGRHTHLDLILPNLRQTLRSVDCNEPVRSRQWLSKKSFSP